MDAAESSSKPQSIRKFDGKNYGTWKYAMEHYLMLSDWYELVIGEEQMPPEPCQRPKAP